MGGKSEAKALMAEAGVPLVPGYHGEDQAPDLLRREAKDLPLLGNAWLYRWDQHAFAFAEALSGPMDGVGELLRIAQSLRVLRLESVLSLRGRKGTTCGLVWLTIEWLTPNSRDRRRIGRSS